jgi:RNA recognition motif-containing protein
VEAAPCNTLFVGNLPWTVDTDGLSALFSRFKPTGAEVQKRLSGRSKGFGTVSFTSVADATTALNAMTGYELEGRVLTVRFDKDNGGSSLTPSPRLFVGNLAWSVDDEVLAEMFTGFDVSSATVKVVNGRSRGFGIVEMKSVAEAQRVLSTKAEFDHEGRTVFVRFDRQ